MSAALLTLKRHALEILNVSSNHLIERLLRVARNKAKITVNSAVRLP